jgi:hypothetical protein
MILFSALVFVYAISISMDSVILSILLAGGAVLLSSGLGSLMIRLKNATVNGGQNSQDYMKKRAS